MPADGTGAHVRYTGGMSAPQPLPLFPLPNVVLLPGGYLPLHVFEARYRCMVQDLLSSRRFVLALLKPGWEAEYFRTPEVYPTACLAELIGHESLPDGRYNIVVRGLERIAILDELRDRPYRRVLGRVLASRGEVEGSDRDRLLGLLQGLLARLSAELPPAFLDRLDSTEDAGALADTVAHILQLPASEKQSFLQEPDRAARVRRLCGRLAEMARRLEER